MNKQQSGLTATQIANAMNVDRSRIYGFLKVLSVSGLARVVSKRHEKTGPPTLLWVFSSNLPKAMELVSRLSKIPESVAEVKAPVKLEEKVVEAKTAVDSNFSEFMFEINSMRTIAITMQEELKQLRQMVQPRSGHGYHE